MESPFPKFSQVQPLKSVINKDDFLCKAVQGLEDVFRRNVETSKKFSGFTKTKTRGEGKTLRLFMQKDTDYVLKAGALLCAAFSEYEVQSFDNVSEYTSILTGKKTIATKQKNNGEVATLIFLDSLENQDLPIIRGAIRISLGPVGAIRMKGIPTLNHWIVPAAGNLYRLINEVYDQIREQQEGRLADPSKEEQKERELVLEADEKFPEELIIDDERLKQRRVAGRKKEAIKNHEITFIPYGDKLITPAERTTLNSKLQDMTMMSNGTHIYKGFFPHFSPLTIYEDLNNRTKTERVILVLHKEDLSPQIMPMSNRIDDLLNVGFSEGSIGVLASGWTPHNLMNPTVKGSQFATVVIPVSTDLSQILSFPSNK